MTKLSRKIHLWIGLSNLFSMTVNKCLVNRQFSTGSREKEQMLFIILCFYIFWDFVTIYRIWFLWIYKNKPKYPREVNWEDLQVIKNSEVALTVMAHLVGCHSTKWKVTGSIPSQGTCVGFRFSPWLGRIWEATYQLL